MKNAAAEENKATAPSSRGWQVWVAWAVILLFAIEIGSALFVKRKDKTFAVSRFAQLPLIFGGRTQPMDSLARNSLIQIRGLTEVPLEGNGANGAWGSWEELRTKEGDLTERRWYQFSKHPKKLKPADWLLEVMCDPEKADDRYIFVINHPDLRSLLKLEGGVEKSGLHFYRFNDIRDRLELLRTEVTRAGKLDASQRNQFDRAVLKLNTAFGLYFRLKNTLQPEDTKDFRKELDEYTAAVAKARTEAQERQARGEKLDRDAIDALVAPVQKIARRYQAMSEMDVPLIVPLAHGHDDHEPWHRMGAALLENGGQELPQPVLLLAGMATAYRTGDVPKFNQLIGEYESLLAKDGLGAAVSKGANETFFNRMLAFKRSMYVYIVGFLLVLLYWSNLNEVWRVAAGRLMVLGLVVHTAGLIFRMALEGRPPVTNLYSSAIFIGWGAAILGLILERIYKDGIGIAVASVVGFLSLIIAHNLSFDGDTMIMLQAVLDTNFWLATHVVVITLGYASTFIAGFLAIIYILRGVFTRTLGEKTAKGLARMVYAIVCFSTLFSFVGTVLGGIWADQSWGRFWGWDPKENGALIIVLWNALILHARWGGLVRERGLMNLAIVGNIVTCWSWFGVNMLGIGLHSYGFMDAAFKWMMIFVGSQLFLIALGSLPLRYWKSFRGSQPPANPPPPPPGAKPMPA